jgi:deoxycytidylate deaminase
MNDKILIKELVKAPSFFRLAENASKYSTHYQFHLGAVLVVNGHPISVGYNQGKSHPDGRFKGLHAEVAAMKTSGKTKIKGSSMFVYRQKRNGSVGGSHPCVDCMKRLKEFGVKLIYYSTEEYPYWEVESLK